MYGMPAMPVQLPQLHTERLIIRLATEGDAPAIVRYLTENRTFLEPFDPVRPPEFYTEEFWRIIAQANIDEFRNDRSLRLFLFLKESPNTVIGMANFVNFVRGAFHACHLGYSIAEEFQGKGYMFEALRVTIDYVFDTVNMHRIMANYMPHNRRSGKLLRRLGFNAEGYARDYLQINGEWEDHILTSLVNPHWG